jgi:hypothetical protein
MIQEEDRKYRSSSELESSENEFLKVTTTKPHLKNMSSSLSK